MKEPQRAKRGEKAEANVDVLSTPTPELKEKAGFLKGKESPINNARLSHKSVFLIPTCPGFSFSLLSLLSLSPHSQ